MIPLLVPIGLGMIGGYLTKDSDHEIYAGGGGVYTSDDTWVVPFQNQDSGEIEKIIVRANNKKNAIEIAEEESGLNYSDWQYYSAEKEYAKGGGVDDDEETGMTYQQLRLHYKSKTAMGFEFEKPIDFDIPSWRKGTSPMNTYISNRPITEKEFNALIKIRKENLKSKRKDDLVKFEEGRMYYRLIFFGEKYVTIHIDIPYKKGEDSGYSYQIFHYKMSK